MKGKTREEYRRQFAAMDLHELLSFAAQLAENHFALLQGGGADPVAVALAGAMLDDLQARTREHAPLRKARGNA
jgi:hypothetical protein